MLILPKAPKRRDFQTIWRLGAETKKIKKKKKEYLRLHSGSSRRFSQEVLAFCTKDSAGLATPLFSLALAAKSGQSNRLELRRGISEQLLHE